MPQRVEVVVDVPIVDLPEDFAARKVSVVSPPWDRGDVASLHLFDLITAPQLVSATVTR